MSYNGWSNWETWNAFTWLSNDPQTDREARYAASKGERVMQEFLDGYVMGMEYSGASLANDYLSQALMEVDYEELVKAFTEE